MKRFKEILPFCGSSYQILGVYGRLRLANHILLVLYREGAKEGREGAKEGREEGRKTNQQSGMFI